MLEKIMEDIETVFKQNEQNIEDENGVHHIVIDSFTAIFLVKKILSNHMKVGKDTNVPINDDWIPVKERLPKVDRCLLMCNVNGCIDVGWWSGKRWLTGFSHADNVDDVIAWQPLPGPYTLKKGVEECQNEES